MADHGCCVPRPESVVDIHDRHAARTAVQHGEQRRDSSEARAVAYASRNSDDRRVGKPRDYARERSKTKDVFVNTPFNIGMVARYMTDWAGPESTVRKVSVKMRQKVK